MKRVWSLVVAAVLLSATLAAAEPTKLLRQPDVHGDKVTFLYAGDVWVAGRDGSDPRRLTVHPGTENHPAFSPDGSMIAFTGEYDGNTDVYVVPTEGGMPVRLTFHPEPDIVRDWSPRGDVLFGSYRANETRRYNRLFTVSPEGGHPVMLKIPRAERASYSPDGGSIAYTYLSDAFTTWKRYRGGLSPFIYLFNFASNEAEILPRHEVGGTYANDSYPTWVGESVYFLSDRAGIMNVFAFDTATGVVDQVTEHNDYDVKSLASDGESLIYEQAGQLHLFTPIAPTPTSIPITINPDLPDTRTQIVDASKMIRDGSVSPTGVRALFEARGDIFSVPADKGEIRNLTRSDDAHERYPSWSPDGSRIAYLSDESGEYQLHIIDQFGREEPTRISLGEPNFYFSPIWSPDSKKILYHERGLRSFYVDVDKKERTVVATDRISSSNAQATWSPDSRYIAYCAELENNYRALFVFDTREGSSHQLTDGMSDARDPVFSRDGKYLFFTASTNYGLSMSGLDMMSYERQVDRNLYLMVLDSESPSPFEPLSDEEDVDVENEDDEADDGDEVEVMIDFENIDQRILAIDVPEHSYGNLQSADGGLLFYQQWDADEAAPLLHRYDLGERESEQVLSSVNGYQISADGKKLFYRGSSGYAITDVKGKIDASDGKLATSDMQVTIDPRNEWAQMLHEAWRHERDFFYDPDMHGADWPAVYKKYEALLPYAGHRSDLNYLIGEMIGELVVGHAYRGGGDFPDVDRVNVGLLGADYQLANGRYRIARIFGGLNWWPDLQSPLTQPGIDVAEGDYIIAVDGVELTAEQSIHALMQGKAGKQLRLTINDEPSAKGARHVTVVPIRSERSLRLYDWVEGNRKKVSEATDGKVGYVYLPNTGWGGYTFFNRYYFSQKNKPGIIIDERFNGGGSVADYMITLMDRPLINWWVTRDNAVYSSPLASHYGKKVMIINENAGSGGDWLPMAFKQRGIGPVVGKRTWGGLIGIGGLPPLIDGGYVTSPSFAIFGKNGEWVVENYGVDPDIEVQQNPQVVIEKSDSHGFGDPQLSRALDEMLNQLEGFSMPTPDLAPRPKRAPLPR